MNKTNNSGSDSESLYETIGGAESVEALVRRFYLHMDTLPEVKELRDMHKGELEPIIQKLFFFLSGWLGGPQLFIEKYGHPRLRARHLPFPIGIKERDQWLYCMNKALDEGQYPAFALEQIRGALTRLADHMRNQEN